MITDASQQLFSRPADEHYDSMQNLLSKAFEDMQNSEETQVKGNQILFENLNDNIALDVRGEMKHLTKYSLSQICQMSNVPIRIIERLIGMGETSLAVENLNKLFSRTDANGDETERLLLTQNGKLRAINGSAYARLWDFTVFDKINEWLIPNGFTPAKPTINTDSDRNNLMGNNKPALFRGDQSSFGFFFTEKGAKEDPTDNLGGLRQGIMIWNSEVGARSFGFSNFYFQDMCANFLIWGATNQKRKRFVHRGDVINNGFADYETMIKEAAKQAEDRRQEDMEVFARAASILFANSDDEAVEKLNEKYKVARPTAEAIVKASYLPQNSNGEELSVWRIANGVTYEAQSTSRAESLVDDSMLATKIIRKTLKV